MSSPFFIQANMPNTSAMPVNNPRTVRAWTMYDWANSVYSLVITSAIFPIYYKEVARGADGSDVVSFFGISVQNSVLYSYSLSFSFLLVAAILPLLSGMADYTGRKKFFMKLFVWTGGLACMGLYGFQSADWVEWGIFCSVMASVGYSGSLVFYDAFLPEIVTEDRYDRTSARGYSMGYFGSVILMVACLIMIMNPTAFWFESAGDATRFSFLLVGVWWIGFAYIPFTLLPEVERARVSGVNVWTSGYLELLKVWHQLKLLPDLKRYLASFFFSNTGVQTVMYLATLFGTDVLHLESTKLIATILLIQLVAAVGASLFSRISQRQGNQMALYIMIAIWMTVCLAAYLITTEWEFYALAFVVGMIMGGIQALSRATYTKLIPEGTADTASYLSFYNVTYNVSIVLGTVTFGIINQLTGNMRYSAVSLTLFFVVGFFLLSRVKSADIRKPVRQ